MCVVSVSLTFVGRRAFESRVIACRYIDTSKLNELYPYVKQLKDDIHNAVIVNIGDIINNEQLQDGMSMFKL